MCIGPTSEMMIDWIFDGGAKAIRAVIVWNTYIRTRFSKLSIHFWCQVNLRRRQIEQRKKKSNQLLLFGSGMQMLCPGLDYKSVSQR